jgi:hypothetical protein
MGVRIWIPLSFPEEGWEASDAGSEPDGPPPPADPAEADPAPTSGDPARTQRLRRWTHRHLSRKTDPPAAE